MRIQSKNLTTRTETGPRVLRSDGTMTAVGPNRTAVPFAIMDGTLIAPSSSSSADGPRS